MVPAAAVLVEGVDDYTILNVCVVTDGDGIDIATQYGIVPYRAVLTNLYVTDDGSVLCQPSAVSNLWRVATYFSD